MGVPIEIAPIRLEGRPGQRVRETFIQRLASQCVFFSLISVALAMGHQEAQVVTFPPLPACMGKKSSNVLLFVLEFVVVSPQLGELLGDTHGGVQQRCVEDPAREGNIVVPPHTAVFLQTLTAKANRLPGIVAQAVVIQPSLPERKKAVGGGRAADFVANIHLTGCAKRLQTQF